MIGRPGKKPSLPVVFIATGSSNSCTIGTPPRRHEALVNHLRQRSPSNPLCQLSPSAISVDFLRQLSASTVSTNCLRQLSLSTFSVNYISPPTVSVNYPAFSEHDDATKVPLHLKPPPLFNRLSQCIDSAQGRVNPSIAASNLDPAQRLQWLNLPLSRRKNPWVRFCGLAMAGGRSEDARDGS